MSEETSKVIRRRGPRKKIEGIFITKVEIGQHIGIGDLDTLDAWIAKGAFPPPHSRPGERFAIWLRKHWKHYVDKGEWPKEAWPKWKDQD